MRWGARWEFRVVNSLERPAPSTTEGTETRSAGHGRMMTKRGTSCNSSTPCPQIICRPLTGGRVVAGLREADSFAGHLPCRPDGRFSAFRGQALMHRSWQWRLTKKSVGVNQKSGGQMKKSSGRNEADGAAARPLAAPHRQTRLSRILSTPVDSTPRLPWSTDRVPRDPSDFPWSLEHLGRQSGLRRMVNAH